MINFVFTAVSPKMPILECMYIKQTIDLLQVSRIATLKSCKRHLKFKYFTYLFLEIYVILIKLN